MGEGEAGGGEGNGLRGRHYNTPDNRGWNTIHQELAAAALSRARTTRWKRLIGLDPAPTAGTGYAELVLDGLRLESCRTLEGRLSDILPVIKPGLIGVDAPLHPPYKGFRCVERLVLKIYRGARLLPGGSRGMARLSTLGLSLYHYLAQAGFPVFETHPGSIIWGLGLRLKGRSHAVDAVIAASAVECALLGESYFFAGVDGFIILPADSCRSVILENLDSCI